MFIVCICVALLVYHVLYQRVPNENRPEENKQQLSHPEVDRDNLKYQQNQESGVNIHKSQMQEDQMQDQMQKAQQVQMQKNKDPIDETHQKSREETPSCSHPHKHLYFLKVHKSGSTTMQNIFLRFSMSNKLNVLTLAKGFKSYPQRVFDKKLPPQPSVLQNGKYDVYCEHSVYDENYLMKLLQPDTINIAIFREPMAQLRSSFNYYGIGKGLNLNHLPDPAAYYIEHMDKYCKAPNSCRVTKNRYATEIGYQADKHNIHEYLSYLQGKFFVLIMEKLSESLVLMKRKLCWDIKDVLYARARQKNYKQPAETNETLIELYKAQSPLNFIIHDYFTRIMESMIAEQDENFHQEVAFLDDCLEETREFCDGICSQMGKLIKYKAGRNEMRAVLDTDLEFEESQWESSFSISGLDCVMMRFGPSVYRNAQKVALLPEYCHPSKRELLDSVLHVPAEFCDDYFNYTFPWSKLYKPQFAAKCY